LSYLHTRFITFRVPIRSRLFELVLR
jgi:hypothetical protein